jgi:phytoene synthase
MNRDPGIARAAAYMAHHSRSFRLASLVLPPRDRERIERVYAWCRFTDNIVDAALPGSTPAEIAGALDEWMRRSEAAYHGAPSGVPGVDLVMREMHDAGAPFAFARTLIAGVRSDLSFRPFPTTIELRDYTFSVASVVGLWLCHLFGARESWILSRATALGHAMQLSNILRDVGEDLRDGRVYLPLDALAAHGLSIDDLRAFESGCAVTPAYRDLIESMIQGAADDYALAREAIPHLPRPFARSVAFAAAVYEGLHDAVRANGYDNFSRRARVTLPRKLVLGGKALSVLESVRTVRPSSVYFTTAAENRLPSTAGAP